MAMTSDKWWKGAWGGDKAPSVIPGAATQKDSVTTYVDENGAVWLVQAYDPKDPHGDGPAFADPKTFKWHASLKDPANIYGEDTGVATIAGSESEFSAVAAIDVYAAWWKRVHITPPAVPATPEGGGGAVLWLVILVAFAMSDGKRRR